MKLRFTPSGGQIAAMRGSVVLVSNVGAASGSRAAAAALACVASESDRAALLIDLTDSRPPHATLIATSGARMLEQRLSNHLPDTQIVSRGQICQLSLPPGAEAIGRITAAVPLARESAAVIHLPPSLVRPVLEEPRIPATSVLLRADLAEARSLTALAVRDLMATGLRVAVLKYPLSWLAARAALLGALPDVGGIAALRGDRLLGRGVMP